MTEYTNSIVLIVPAAQRAKADELAEAMGWGPDNYGVELSSDGNVPAMHYGLVTVCTPGSVSTLTDAEQGTMPPELVDAEYPPADFSEVVGALIADVQDRTVLNRREHIEDVLTGNGLQRIVPEEIP